MGTRRVRGILRKRSERRGYVKGPVLWRRFQFARKCEIFSVYMLQKRILVILSVLRTDVREGVFKFFLKI
jgi:hypothetical protein